jgi:phosphatidylinositol 4-kinase
MHTLTYARTHVHTRAHTHVHTHIHTHACAQIKDRHNGNILLDDQGHLVHIDFGFMLSNSPGGVNFEAAPFKLTREMLEVMDSNSEGKPSEMFDYFKVCVRVCVCVRACEGGVCVGERVRVVCGVYFWSGVVGCMLVRCVDKHLFNGVVDCVLLDCHTKSHLPTN